MWIKSDKFFTFFFFVKARCSVFTAGWNEQAFSVEPPKKISRNFVQSFSRKT